MQTIELTQNYQSITALEKKLVEGRCVRSVPPILMKLVFLDSARTKLLESDPLS
jgi:hypothetical protein